jgi:hypothetical protein
MAREPGWHKTKFRRELVGIGQLVARVRLCGRATLTFFWATFDGFGP